MTYRARCKRRREESQAVQKMRAGWWHLFGVFRPSFSFVKFRRIEKRADDYAEFFRNPEEGE